MNVELDWVAVAEKGGIALVAILILYFGFKIFELFISQWKASTDAMNKNTEAFTQLSSVFERSHEREVEFQEKAMELMLETNDKVKDIHKEIIR